MKLDELSGAIESELTDYLTDTTEKMRAVVDSVTEETVDTLKATSPKKTGHYARGWKSKVTVDTNTGRTKTIHNRTPGLTHLLEDGHAKQNGGRVEGRKHIAPVEKAAIHSFEEQLERELRT